LSTQHCVFCSVALQPSHLQLSGSRTKEHVYARWYRDHVVHDRIKLFTVDGQEPPVLHQKEHLNNFINNSVCKECNNGWMSNLETSVDPIVDKLTSGTDIKALSTEEVETLARWTAKTAIVLGYILPVSIIVPEFIRRSLLPDSDKPPQMRFFYAYLKINLTLEAAYLQLRYGAETPIIGEESAPGTRFTLCVYNHCLTIDFPPMLAGLEYDLTESCSAQLWPKLQAAGTSELSSAAPMSLSDVLLAVCKRIHVRYNLAALRA
jgi:hypothetical protein